MHDDSEIKRTSTLKSKSSLTDSFRMAASLLGSNSMPNTRSFQINVPNLKLKQKQSYKKQPQCQICFVPFGKFGQHHCRICANAVCSTCSMSTINKQRACDKCAHLYSSQNLQKDKESIINQLTNICIGYLALKNKTQQQIKKVELQIPSQQGIKNQKKQNQIKLKQMQDRLDMMIKRKKQLQAEIATIKSQ